MKWRLTSDWLETRGIPQDEISEFLRLYPKGCEMTLNRALDLENKRIVDVVNIGCELLIPERRPPFAYFTLMQREHPIAELLRMTDLGDLAEGIEGVNWGDLQDCSRVLGVIFEATSAVGEGRRNTHEGTIAGICAHLVADAARDAEATMGHVLAFNRARQNADEMVRAAGLPRFVDTPGWSRLGVDSAVQAALNAVEAATMMVYVTEESVTPLAFECCYAAHTGEGAYLLATAALADAASAEIRSAALRLVVETRAAQIRWIWRVLEEDFR